MKKQMMSGWPKRLRAQLRAGIEAALKANPRQLSECEPRTGMGLAIRGLVLEAGRGKMPAFRLMLDLLDWEEPEGASGARRETADEELFPEPDWDWDSRRKWTTEAARDCANLEPESGKQANLTAKAPAARQTLEQNFLRLHESDQDEERRQAKLLGSTSLSGNIKGAAPPMAFRTRGA